MVIEVGDKIRMTVELLEQLKEQEDSAHTVIVDVVAIEEYDVFGKPGLKTMTLGRTKDA